MAYDPATSQVLLFGGSNGSNLNDTWAWNGTTWTEVATTGPSARDNAQMAYDPATGQVIMYGGYSGGALGDTWAWNGTTWTEVATSGPPALYRGGHGLRHGQ